MIEEAQLERLTRETEEREQTLRWQQRALEEEIEEQWRERLLEEMEASAYEGDTTHYRSARIPFLSPSIQ